MKKRFVLRISFLLIAIEGAVVGGIIFNRRLPHGGLTFNTGLTLKNIFLILIAALIAIICLIVLLITINRPALLDRLIAWAKKDQTLKVFWLIAVFIIVECTQTLIFVYSADLKNEYQFNHYLNLLISLEPLILYGLLVTIQITIAFLIINGFKILKTELSRSTRVWLLGAGLLILIWIGIGFTDFGFIESTTRSVRQSVGKFLPLVKPIPGFQVSVSLILSLSVSAVVHKLAKVKKNIARTDYVQVGLIVLIWALAILAWISVPIESNFLIDIPSYDADVIYPSSDAFYYDKEANRFLLGKEFDESSTHVFYSFFLSGLKLVVGDDYQKTVNAQYLILGLVPVLLYLITKKLSFDFSGLFLAFMYIFRERNGLLLGSELAGPLVNAFASENLALVGLLFFIYMLFLWFENPDQRKFYPAIAGGFIGISLLIRADYLALLIAGITVVLVFLWKDRKIIFPGMVQLLSVCLVIIIPWMWRNYQVRGIFSLDKGDYVGTRVAEYVQHISVEESAGQEQETGTLPENGGKYNRVTAFYNHIVNSYHQSFLFLPNNHLPGYVYGSILFTDLFDNASFKNLGITERYLNLYINSIPYYWYSWTGKVIPVSIIPIAFALSMIWLGLIKIWKRNHIYILFLLGIFGAHILVWAFANFSGSRITKAIEWIPWLFYSVGLSVALLNLLSKIKIDCLVNFLPAGLGDQIKEPSRGISRNFSLILILFLLLLGLGPTVLEKRIPERFTYADQEDIVNKVITEAPQSDLANFIDGTSLQADGEILYGEAYYPRYFEKGFIYPDSRKGTLPAPDRSRIDFYLIGTDIIWVSLPATSPDQVFKNGAQVLVGGHVEMTTYLDYFSKPYIMADWVNVLDEELPVEDQTLLVCEGMSCPE